MNEPWTIDKLLVPLQTSQLPRLPKPTFSPKDDSRRRIMLAVESMRRHMTNEGFEIAQGLESAGYDLVGHRLTFDHTDVRRIYQSLKPGTVVVQDKREWDVQPGDFREHEARFHHVSCLAYQPEVFRLTILKDAHQRPEYHRESADEIDCHAWVVYYHPRIVSYMATYVRPEHLVRTYHSVDSDLVPAYSPNRHQQCLLSGAVSSAYPLRLLIVRNLANCPEITYLSHPGYHRNGCATPQFLQNLSHFKVAICTASMYGYALRKIIEATACGCRVLTDLPVDEVLPEIDGNLFRIRPDTSAYHVQIYVHQLIKEYDADKQRDYAEKAKNWYDYKAVGKRLSDDIESLRRNYNGR